MYYHTNKFLMFLSLFFFFKIFILSKEIKKEKNNIILSLTSYPARIKTVHKTIKSLLTQTLKPEKIILWLTESEFPKREKNLPKELKKQIKQGLSIEYYKNNIRSYTKLIPTLKKYPNKIIVTADDDIIYKKDWLERLYKDHLKYPNFIVAHRITKFIYKSNSFNVIRGGFHYYKKPSFLNELTGVGGVLYFPNCFFEDVLNEDLFMKLAPTNDDIWFWLQAVLKGIKIKVIDNPYIKLKYVPHTQTVGLFNINNKGKNLFWKDFNRILNYYPKLKNILIKEYDNMKNNDKNDL